MKHLLFCIIFFLSFCSSLNAITEREPDDLFSYEVFNSSDKKLVKRLYRDLARKFHTDLSPEQSSEPFQIISVAYHNIMNNVEGDLSIIPHSRNIFNNIIKPYLNELMEVIKFENAVAVNNKFHEIIKEEHPPIIKLRDINHTITQLKNIVHQSVLIKQTIADIKRYNYKEMSSNKIERFLTEVNKFKFLSDEELIILKQKIEDRINQLLPAFLFWKKFYPILLLNDLITGKSELLKKMIQAYTENRFFFPRELNYTVAVNFIKDLRDNDVVTPFGEIKSLENAFRLLLKLIKEIENDSYLNEKTPQAQSILKEVKKFEATFKAHLNKPDFMQVLPALYSTLEALALAKDNLNLA